MIVYKLEQDAMDTLSVSAAGSKMPPAGHSLHVDNVCFSEKYGIDMAEQEVALFKAHYAIWNDFTTNRNDDYCIVLEHGVELSVSANKIAEALNTIPEAWDIFFPYDKVNSPAGTNPISLSHFGFFWGYYFYVLNQKGAAKLLQIKTIQQPLDEQILLESLGKNLTIYAGHTDWFHFDETLSWAYRARSGSIIRFFEQYNVWEQEDKTKALEMLSYILEKGKQTGVKIGLHAGTLLGAVRHGKIMDWDDDIDLMICENDANKLLEAIKSDGIYNITNWIWKKTGEVYYKIWQEGGKYTEGFEYAFPFIDIWIYREEEKHIATIDGYSFEKSTFFPLQQIQFETGNFYIPHDARAYLNVMYNGWDKAIKIFSWSHQNKQHINTKLIIPIITDSFGKFVSYNH